MTGRGMKRFLLGVLTAAALGCAAYLGAGWVVYDRLSRVEPGAFPANTPANFNITSSCWKGRDAAPYFMPRYEPVEFPSRTPGLRLRGWFVPGDPGMPAVVLTHGISDSKSDPGVLLPAGMLHRSGFAVLLFDLRNHGTSDVEDGRTSIGNREYLDVLAAWDWLRAARGYAPDRIGLFGVSLGAGTTLIAFAHEPRIAAAWVDSPYSDLLRICREELRRKHYPEFLAYGGLLTARLTGHGDLLANSPAEAVSRDAGRPLFSVHGVADVRVRPEHTRILERQARRDGANLRAWYVPHAGHADAVFLVPDEYERRMTEFFHSSLAGSRRGVVLGR